MADKQQAFAKTNGIKTTFKTEAVNIGTWLEQTSKEEPWTVYCCLNRTPTAGQSSQLRSLEGDTERDERRVGCGDS